MSASLGIALSYTLQEKNNQGGAVVPTYIVP
jgi:hypothetical protein